MDFWEEAGKFDWHGKIMLTLHQFYSIYASAVAAMDTNIGKSMKRGHVAQYLSMDPDAMAGHPILRHLSMIVMKIADLIVILLEKFEHALELLPNRKHFGIGHTKKNSSSKHGCPFAKIASKLKTIRSFFHVILGDIVHHIWNVAMGNLTPMSMIQESF